jgi:hypothetical protein
LILTSLAFQRCLCPSVPSLAQASPPCGPSLQSLQLTLHTCNQSIKPSLVLIFSTLVTWLHVMSHMQWAPSSHVWSLCQIYGPGVPAPPVYVTITELSAQQPPGRRPARADTVDQRGDQGKLGQAYLDDS